MLTATHVQRHLPLLAPCMPPRVWRPRRLALSLGAFGLAWLFASPVWAGAGLPRSERPEGAEVYIITPRGGDKLESPITVRFGLKKMGVAPAGVEKEATGHHHLIIDAELPAPDLPIPASDNYRHFGKGQTEVELDLDPGEHTLQLVLGDHLHIPHDPPVVSERITITVE